MWRSTQLASQVSRLKPTGLLCMGWMKELVYSVKMGMRDALLGRILDAADRIKNSRQNLQQATRSSQSSGSQCCGQQWHFRKPTLSTYQFKLKVISRS